MNDSTRTRIRKLRIEAELAGDLRMATICVLALGGDAALDGAEPGTEAAALLGHTQEWAIAQCTRAINAAINAADQ